MTRRDWLKLSAAGLVPAAFAAEAIPDHPTKLEFPKLVYDPPSPAQYRRELAGGAVAYMVEDHQLPLISISLIVRGGEYLEGDDVIGLAGMTASQMRSGGTTSMSAAEFDEEAAFLATELGCGFGATSGSAGVSCLAQNLDRSLELFFDMLKTPRFDPSRLSLAVAGALQGMERRNDDTGGIISREYARLIRGDHFTTRPTTKATIEAITPDRMREFHGKYFHPASFLFSISGDFDSDEMADKLNAALTAAGWPAAAPNVPPVPKPNHHPAPGVYMVQKDGVNQSQIRLGHLGIERSNPDHIAAGVMNDILGGGGFISRIMGRVRSDEGLAYSAGSNFSPGTYYPGVFTASFQSQNPKCAEATSIVLEEIDRIRQEKVSAEELEISKNSAVEIFPRYFATAGQVAGTFASDEYTGREEGYWEQYRDRVAAVTADDVLRVAQQYLHPDKLAIVGVGAVPEMMAGNPDKPQYSFKKIAGDREIQRIPLPDPMTMEYPKS